MPQVTSILSKIFFGLIWRFNYRFVVVAPTPSPLDQPTRLSCENADQTLRNKHGYYYYKSSAKLQLSRAIVARWNKCSIKVLFRMKVSKCPVDILLHNAIFLCLPFCYFFFLYYLKYQFFVREKKLFCNWFHLNRILFKNKIKRRMKRKTHCSIFSHRKQRRKRTRYSGVQKSQAQIVPCNRVVVHKSWHPIFCERSPVQIKATSYSNTIRTCSWWSSTFLYTGLIRTHLCQRYQPSHVYQMPARLLCASIMAQCTIYMSKHHHDRMHIYGCILFFYIIIIGNILML